MGLRAMQGISLANPGTIGGTTPASITGTVITATTKFLAPDGSASDPGYGFASATNTGWYRDTSNGALKPAVAGVSPMSIFGAIIHFGATTLRFGSAVGTSDAIISRLSAGVMGQQSGATAQTYQIYSTSTDASNYERLALKTTAGSKVTVAAETAGTGADNLDLELVPAGTGVVQFSNAQNGAAAAAGTLLNAPTAGNPSEWLKVKVGANVRYIPAWA